MQKVEWKANRYLPPSSLGRTLSDLLLSQTAVEAWGSFARMFDPNPSPAYLVARGYATANALKKAGTWNAVGGHGRR